MADQDSRDHSPRTPGPKDRPRRRPEPGKTQPGKVQAEKTQPEKAEPEKAEGERLTWAGNKPLDTRWWWSPSLLVVVGVVVIIYQVSAITSEEGGIILNWVMAAVGAGFAIAGLVQLKRAYDATQSGDGAAPGGDPQG